jgi:hypothetical protein
MIKNKKILSDLLEERIKNIKFIKWYNKNFIKFLR